MYRLVFFVITLLMLPNFSLAAGCYTPQEAEAEQGIRIHSELMVIGLNCQHMTPRGWKNFYQEYREITNSHKSLFSQYEQTLISHYSRNGSGSAERKVHDLRTQFANKVSADVAQMRPDIFCSTYAPRIPQTARMGQDEFKQWVRATSQTQRLSKTICR